MFPSFMAMGLTGSWLIVLLIGLGFILNSFQIVCNCYIGTTRIMVAQGLDGLLPDWFARVSPRWKTPVNAHLAYFLAALPVIWAFNKVGDWSTKWALGVTFANGAVMVLSALAAALLPYRAKKATRPLRAPSTTSGASPPLRSSVFSASCSAGSWWRASCSWKDLGLAFTNSAFPYMIVVGTVVPLIIYFVMRSVRGEGIKVEYAFTEIPPE